MEIYNYDLYFILGTFLEIGAHNMSDAVMTKKPTLLSVIGLGVGPIIGSGWLFASYLVAKQSGSYSFIAWIIGAVLVLSMSLLLGEIASVYHERGLFSRLMSMSHNKDIGFIFAISNLLGTVAVIPAESAATVQYFAILLPKSMMHFIYNTSGGLAFGGLVCVILLIVVYTLLNWWGIQIMAKTNSFITILKVIVPVSTVIILLSTSFHPENFSVNYYSGLHHYDITSAFSAVSSGGVFFAFFGFQNISFFASEIDHPEKTIPLALISSILITLILFLCLQASFIGAIPTGWLKSGWIGVNLHSPLAELLIALNLNWFLSILYVGSAVCPFGSGMVYMGSGPRGLTAMARERQMPRFFARLNPVYHVSRRSLVAIFLVGSFMILFFNSWDQIMMVTSGFQLLTCVAVPISFLKFRYKKTTINSPFKVPYGHAIALVLFILDSYLLYSVSLRVLAVVEIMLVFFFVCYCVSFYQTFLQIKNAFRSSYIVLLYFLVLLFFKLLGVYTSVLDGYPYLFYTAYIILHVILFLLFLKQDDYNPSLEPSMTFNKKEES